ncbi:hypothetical protein Q5H92_08010 [Hymenobacter sp. M29]|uniref:Uncharacterized protein n=1 Tax=Hymenobacter mellowenesis TaxID=3063995 RepID=A0ABT9A8Y7_9BACT|nr:hypothetical protein [Hymenobacter sp. M29]MDO7846295.1 hypothetical protein [Hymenobacter sp. M29]
MGKVWYIGVVGAGLVGLYRACKAAGAIPTRVTVGPDRVVVLKIRASEEVQVPYAQVAAYRAQSFNGSEELRLTLKDGSRYKVSVNSQLYGEQPFGAMVAAFEAALGAHPQPAGAAHPVVREPTFFEKPISTVVLVAFTALLVWAAWMILTNDRQVRGGSLIGALGGYAAYVASWLAARERRKGN